MRVYISGPMSGLPGHNFPAFFAAAEALRRAGHEPVNPADGGVRHGWSWSDYLRHDIRLMLDRAEAVALLPGWERSRGSRLEAHVARELGWPVRPLEEWLADGSATGGGQGRWS